eukprot:2949640-Pyramimonas_sp.AAC.1
MPVFHWLTPPFPTIRKPKHRNLEGGGLAPWDLIRKLTHPTGPHNMPLPTPHRLLGAPAGIRPSMRPVSALRLGPKRHPT